jgi:hypothetical protein
MVTGEGSMVKRGIRLPRATLGVLLGIAVFIAFFYVYGNSHPGSNRGQLGVSVSADGALLLYYNPCHPESLVTQIKLVEIHGTVYGDEDDPVLWQVRSTSGSMQREFIAGETPVGFIEEVELTDALQNRRYGVFVDRSAKDLHPSMSFGYQMLRADSVLSDGEYLPFGEFRSRKNCFD